MISMDGKDVNVNLKNKQQVSAEMLTQIKEMNDKYKGKREWLAQVYYTPDKGFVLGAPVLGDYSGVTLRPDEQTLKDTFATGVKDCMTDGTGKEQCKALMHQQIEQSGAEAYGVKRNRYGVSKSDYFTTLHLHPIRQFETPGNASLRKNFSGTDIGSEFAKAIRDDSHPTMMLTYPDKKGMTQHNMLKFIVFPGKKSMEIMKRSNPRVSEEDILSITPEGKNIEKVDWYAYQEQSAKEGYLQVIDIEEETGLHAYAAHSNRYLIFVVAGIAAALAVVFIVNYRRKKAARQ